MDLRIFTEPQQGADYDLLLTVAKAAEDLGFDAFFRSDHYLKMGSGTGKPGPPDTWVTLAGIAEVESQHGTIGGRTLLPDGRPSVPIIGPALDGANANRVIADTDGGADFDPAFSVFQALATPGSCSASFIWSTSCSVEIWSGVMRRKTRAAQPGAQSEYQVSTFRHCSGGFSTTTVSIMDSGAGSVEVSARPAFPRTV